MLILKFKVKLTLHYFQCWVSFAIYYNFKLLNLQKENEEHHRLLKGTAFKLNLYPREYFDANPYMSDEPLPPIKKVEKKEIVGSPFKPSSPGKKVS